MKTTSQTSRRHEAYQPAALQAGRFYTDLGSCGTRSLGWSDAHDPTETRDAAACEYLSLDGQTYTATGKTGTRYDDGTPAREFATEQDARLWLANDGRIQQD